MQRSENPDGAQWHVVYIRAKEEARAHDLLKRHRFEVYYPMMRTMVTPPLRQLTPAKRKMAHQLARPVLKPLFPRYHFVRFDRECQPWQELFRRAGVLGMVCEGGRITPLPDIFVEQIKAQEVEDAVPGSAPVAAFVVGGPAKIADYGPFFGHVGTIEKLHDDGRVELLLSLLGRKIRYETTVGELWPVEV